MPTNLAQENVDKKDALEANRSYTTKKRDIHEADASHLDRAKANYEELCQLYPSEFTAVQCVDSTGNMRSIDDIQTEIKSIVSTLARNQ
jgi:thymidylate kinase